MLPRLLHPVPILLRKADRKFTAVWDDNLQEAVGQVRRERKPLKLVAQMRIQKVRDPNATSGGIELESDGYALFRTVDLRGAGDVKVERGDRIIQWGEGDNAVGCDYYITKLQHIGHYPRAKGATMIKAFFEEREPSRRDGDL